MSLWPEIPAENQPPSLQLGLSPCPSDAFMFHALLHDTLRVPGLGAVQPFLADLQELSQRALDPAKALAVTRLGAPALAQVVDRYAVLPTGAAMGYGLGPLVVRRPGGPSGLAELAGRRVAMPGEHTNGWLLLRIFGPPDMVPMPMGQEEIADAVRSGASDAGLIPHERRLIQQDSDLEPLADLGDVWEEATQLPLPLGLLCVRRDLPPEFVDALVVGIRTSVRAGFDRPGRSWDFVRAHGRGMDEEVCRRHIHLYVGDHALDIGHTGRRAVEELLARGRDAGMLPAGRSPWRDPA